MILSITQSNLGEYVTKQLNNFFPDNIQWDKAHFYKSLNQSLEKLEFCFKHISLPYFRKEKNVYFNHLNTDQYSMFLYLFSNIIWSEYGDEILATKLMYLNKMLNGLNCMYDTKLPDIFCFIHIVGTVLGKANYGNYLAVYQGVTVGTHENETPVIGEYVSLLPHSAVIGKCKIGNRVSIGLGTKIYKTDIPDNHIAVAGKEDQIQIKLSRKLYSCKIFNMVNLI